MNGLVSTFIFSYDPSLHVSLFFSNGKSFYCRFIFNARLHVLIFHWSFFEKAVILVFSSPKEICMDSCVNLPCHWSIDVLMLFHHSNFMIEIQIEVSICCSPTSLFFYVLSKTLVEDLIFSNKRFLFRSK